MKPEIRYGLIYGGISVLWTLIMYVTELNRSDYDWVVNLLSLVVPIVCMVMAVNEIKAAQSGYITFNQSFKKTLTVILIGGTIAAVFAVIYMNWIDPGFLEFTKNKQVIKMQEMGLSDDVIEKQMAQSEKFYQPQWMFLFSIVGILFFGSIFALIVSAIMKKPNPEEIA
jgi:lipopolysaccharide/colanic/teichoic acid biosynthesis glycosyltransferase